MYCFLLYFIFSLPFGAPELSLHPCKVPWRSETIEILGHLFTIVLGCLKLGKLGLLWILIMCKSMYFPQAKMRNRDRQEKKMQFYMTAIYLNWHWSSPWRASNSSLSWYPCCLTPSGKPAPTFIILRMQTCHPASGLHLCSFHFVYLPPPCSYPFYYLCFSKTRHLNGCKYLSILHSNL